MVTIDNSMHVIIGLCHSFNRKGVTFQESFFACKRKLSMTSRLLRQATTWQLPRSSMLADRQLLGDLTTAITCDTGR